MGFTTLYHRHSTKLTQELEELKEDRLMQQAHSMRDNLKFFNVPDEEKENRRTNKRIYEKPDENF